MKLPTIHQIFQYILYLQETSAVSHPVKPSISHAIEHIFSFWAMAGIKTIGRQYAEKFRKLWNQWMKLKRNQSRKKDPGGKRQLFQQELDKLWDITNPEASTVTQSNKFLSREKKGRKHFFLSRPEKQANGIHARERYKCCMGSYYVSKNDSNINLKPEVAMKRR